MGTSTRQRSPRTPEWEAVNRLYDDPQAPPGVIVSAIVDALGPGTRERMADSAVSRCMATLTSAAAGLLSPTELSLDPSLSAAADLAAALRASAEGDIAQARVGSRFGEIALDALSSATLEAVGDAAAPEVARATLARYAEERRLSQLLKTFLSHDVAYAFKYFVDRDAPAHVGGPRLQTAADASRLADDIAGLCRQTASGLNLGHLEDSLQRATGGALGRGDPLYQTTFRKALAESLRAFEGRS
jgi:hypothetical protein